MTEADLLQALQDCRLCPRACHANRIQGRAGVCGAVGTQVYLSRADVHTMEEPCISGTRGSGTVFFDGCNLKCIFCQNAAISHSYGGKSYAPDALSTLFLQMQEKGVHNLNLVTPTHVCAQIAYALEQAKGQGLKIPILYNCGGYESVDSLRMLDGLIDIYLPDFKYLDSETAKAYSQAPDYPTVARRAIAEMVRQCPLLTLDEDGIAQKGVLVRHLVLPEKTRAAKQILSYLHRVYGDRIGISILRQYTPMEATKDLPPLNRCVYDSEYDSVLSHANAIGITRAYLQEKDSVGKEFIPAFREEKKIP